MGRSFCAGADVDVDARLDRAAVDENEADAAALAAMLAAIDRCPVPVIARVQGAALGGGMGLCAVADIVLATADATFGFTETKLGILPAVISPFVLAKIGEGHARALFPTGERFDAERARASAWSMRCCADEAALDGRMAAVLGELRSPDRPRPAPPRRSSASSAGYRAGSGASLTVRPSRGSDVAGGTGGPDRVPGQAPPPGALSAQAPGDRW